MRPRIVFVVMSAVSPAGTVDQLAAALAPHQVLVHHDFSQTPEFPLASPNVSFVPDPVRTGWASFGFVEGIFHSMAHAVQHLDFDYLQLLSPTCLPIKPMEQFEARVGEPVDAHFGAIDLLGDRDCLMSVGYRAFTPLGSFRHRVLRRLATEYFGGAPDRRDEAGVWLHGGGGRGWKALAARAAVQLAAAGALGPHPFGQQLRPYYGSVWFGARPHVVRGMVEEFRRPEIHDYFAGLRIAEEFLVPTLLMRHAQRRGGFHHYISRFDQAHPSKLDVKDLDELRASPAFFARKFPEDVQAPIRLRVLRELAQLDPLLSVAPVLQPEAVRGGVQHECHQPRPAHPVRPVLAVPEAGSLGVGSVAAARAGGS
ncbi:MAG TPA: hypothetical protein VEA40_25195 [Ramlibacter sp.]|nr:hypothetical protein [Ramlibacter sp.]